MDYESLSLPSPLAKAVSITMQSYNQRQTYRAGLVTELSLPARRAKAGPIHGVAGCSVGTVTRLVAAEAPTATGAWNGTICPLPPYKTENKNDVLVPHQFPPLSGEMHPF